MGNKVLILPWEKLDFLLTKVRSLSEGHTLEQSRIDREKSVTHASVFSSVKHEQPRMLLGKAPRPSRALSQLWGVTHGQGSGTQNAHWVRKLFHCFSFFFFFPEKLRHEDLDSIQDSYLTGIQARPFFCSLLCS